MYNLNFFPVILATAMSLFSCAVRSNIHQPGDAVFKVCQIVIISPYGCYQEIEINSCGAGYLKSGLYNGNIKDENVILDTIFSIDSFYIQGERDLKKIHGIIKSILNKENIKGGAKTDTYRHKLFVDEINKIDTYGLSKDLQELLKQMIIYLPLSNDKCEFFELLKNKYYSQ